MHNHYIINEAVEFHPATSTLHDLHNPDVVVALNSPAGRCLLLLISRVGAIVTQQEFMDIVWKQSGMRVTSNAYYQNISVLRKGLKRIGLGEDIIVTIPRIGLTLATGTRIRKLTTEPLVEIDHENAHFIDVNALTPEEPKSDSSELTAGRSVEISLANEEHPQKKILIDDKKSLATKLSRYSLILAVVIIAIIFIAWYATKTTSNFFSDYVAVKSIKGCKILLSQPLPARSYQEYAQGFGERFIEDCQDYPWIYVTKIPHLSRTSVIRCDKPFEHSTSCISEYFIE
ncbi:winged helix-turn-helix domain-containing protein [Cedecea colo]|uniref:Transcriptional regulator n=1 Tax=Cedecea colo TaxID=2552946 RepID=A0ABX0VLC8_9ENTR|nr:winged helix-turn-helix domain-containing protein [Cedecea colo]NIY47844.1 transcriptional regulator [Cedecea colo]